MSSPYRGCNDVFGTFAVNQISSDGDGNITMLDASFTQRCESATAPPLTGTIRYQAVPLSYRFSSDPGDFVGHGVHKAYTNSTTVFGMRATASGSRSRSRACTTSGGSSSTRRT